MSFSSGIEYQPYANPKALLLIRFNKRIDDCVVMRYPKGDRSRSPYFVPHADYGKYEGLQSLLSLCRASRASDSVSLVLLPRWQNFVFPDSGTIIDWFNTCQNSVDPQTGKPLSEAEKENVIRVVVTGTGESRCFDASSLTKFWADSDPFYIGTKRAEGQVNPTLGRQVFQLPGLNIWITTAVHVAITNRKSFRSFWGKNTLFSLKKCPAAVLVVKKDGESLSIVLYDLDNAS